MKVIMLKGLPGSGKSTWALEQVTKHENYKRINKDDLRAMLDGGKWSKEREKYVIETRDWLISLALQKGMNVIIDDTNFAPKHEERIKELARGHSAEFEIKFFDTPLEECIERDAKRAKPVGEKVIRDMYKQYLYKPAPTPEYNENLQDVVLVDIDGTLAHMEGRGAFEWNRVGEDRPDNNLIELLHLIWEKYAIIIFSGRDAVCREETEEWLKKYGVPYKALYMRPFEDKRKDSIVKKELYEQYVKDKFNVKFILDDRNQVVEMWRSLGLKCLQVADGNF